MNSERKQKRNLVLSRTEGERIMIGENVVVQFVRYCGTINGKHKIRLMISAPENIEVDREEVRERKIMLKANYGDY